MRPRSIRTPNAAVEYREPETFLCEGGIDVVLTRMAWILTLFFAVNIGASGTGASMAAAYGAGAVSKRWVALLLAAAAVFCGAVTGGGPVAETVGQGIVPRQAFGPETVMLVLIAAASTLLAANLMGVPLSTSEVTVGSVVGLGVAYHVFFAGKIAVIVLVWLVLPFLAYGLSLTIGRWIRRLAGPRSRWRHHPGARGLVITFLVASGCYEAFSAGMNNVANAIGPLVAAHQVSLHAGLFWGAAFVAVGAFTLGGRVLNTSARQVTSLSLLEGSAVSVTSGTLVVLASLAGLPVPLAQATTMAIVGLGESQDRGHLWKRPIMRRIMGVWIASPVLSLGISYTLVETVMRGQWGGVALLGGIGVLGMGRWRARRAAQAQRNRSISKP